MRIRVTLLLAALLSMAGGGQSARVLAVLPFPGRSHHIFMSAVLRALSDRGHQVVEYSPFPPSTPRANHTHVPVHTSLEAHIQKWTYEEFIRFTEIDQPKLLGITTIWQHTYALCADTLKHENVKKLLRSNKHFDVVITESTFGQEPLLVFGHRFRAPTITLQVFPPGNVLNRDAGNALSIATIPDISSLVATDNMSFAERFYNFISTTVTLFYYYNYHLPAQERIIMNHYNEESPPLVDMIRNVSLYLVNAHSAAAYSQPYSPNIIPIAGITVSPERATLHQDVQRFMDEAKEGVIYFSLGTLVPAHILPQEVLQIFVNVFSKITRRVLWKTDLERVPHLSSNVMLTKWVAQPGVLAHRNCVLFLTHGGLMSQQEAIHAGVPTVSIPFFGDQLYNVRFNEYHGIGVKLDFKTLSEETLMSALIKVLNDPKYQENAEHLSRIYHDQPVSPAESAVFWTEYVMRHAGSPHLRPAAAHLPWYQLTLLDILATLTVATFMLYRLLRAIVSLAISKRVKVSNRKKDN